MLFFLARLRRKREQAAQAATDATRIANEFTIAKEAERFFVETRERVYIEHLKYRATHAVEKWPSALELESVMHRLETAYAAAAIGGRRMPADARARVAESMPHMHRAHAHKHLRSVK